MRIDLPPDVRASDPEFLALLNDRLRRLSSSASGSATVSGGGGTGVTQLTLTVPGTLAIQADAAPHVALSGRRAVSEVVVLVKEAPLGADLEVEVMAGVRSLVAVTVPAGATAASAASAGGAIAADEVVRVRLNAVGTSFPGADLSVLIRLA